MTSGTVVQKLGKGLNAPQKKAVISSFDRHRLILAGAGCGKTAVLTRRIAFCATTHCEQSRILALTFTRKAALEMQKRLLTLAGIDKNSTLPVVTTFHGFSMRVLKEAFEGIPNFQRLGYSKEPTLVTQRERLELLAEITTTDQRRTAGVTISELDDLLSRYVAHPQKISSQPDYTQTIVKKLAEDFAAAKRERNCWEFSDMIKNVLTLLSSGPQIAAHYAKRFACILVDEFQDTNPLQIRLLNKVLSSENRLFAVGDDDQAIYGFRGADIGPIMHFTDHFQGAEIIKLETNYRSSPAVLATANKIFRDKPQQFKKVLVSGKYGTSKKDFGRIPGKKSFPDSGALAQWILDTSEIISKDEGIAPSDMAVLFRLNETLQTVKSEVEKRASSTELLPGFLTIHGSKGLEFPVVFLCDLEESVFPHYRMKKSMAIRSWTDVLKRIFLRGRVPAPACDFDEEKRLFYVGVTRAERFLFILSTREKLVNGRRVAFEPSRFLRLI